MHVLCGTSDLRALVPPMTKCAKPCVSPSALCAHASAPCRSRAGDEGRVSSRASAGAVAAGKARCCPALPLEIWRLISGFAVLGLVAREVCPSFNDRFVPDCGPPISDTKRSLLLTSKCIQEASRPCRLESLQLTFRGMQLFLEKLDSKAIPAASVKSIRFVCSPPTPTHAALETASGILSHCKELDTLDLSSFLNSVRKEYVSASSVRRVADTSHQRDSQTPGSVLQSLGDGAVRPQDTVHRGHAPGAIHRQRREC